MGALDVRHPVPDRRRDRLLERPGACVDRLDARAQQPHPLDVGLLPAHVLGAHVDHALEVEQRAGGSGSDAVLAGPGLGDDPRLAHPPGQQRLTDRVVDLVGAGVVEVLALEVDRAPGGLAQPPGRIQRRGAADVVAQQAVQFGAKAVVLGRRDPGRLELGQRRHQRLGDVLATVGPEPVLDRAHGATSGAAPALVPAPRTPGAWPVTLRPGARLDSAGHVDRERLHGRDRLGHVVGVQSAGEDHRHLAAVGSRELPGERLAGPAGLARHVAVEQVVVGVKRGQGLDVGAAAHPCRLDHLAAGAPRRLGAERRPLVAVELEHGQPDRVRRLRPGSPGVGLTNTPATSTRRLSAAAISAAAPGSQRRGECGQKIMPIAQAPAVPPLGRRRAW